MKLSTGVVHEIPDDMLKVLSSDESAIERWEDLTPLARNEWICWV
ncbi:MAG: YdeI/OmpD-associated family protein, partial [Alphaproteobacteria bacterium]